MHSMGNHGYFSCVLEYLLLCMHWKSWLQRKGIPCSGTTMERRMHDPTSYGLFVSSVGMLFFALCMLVNSIQIQL